MPAHILAAYRAAEPALYVAFAGTRRGAAILSTDGVHVGDVRCIAHRVSTLLGPAGRGLVDWVLAERDACARRVVLVDGRGAYGVEMHVPAVMAPGGVA